MTLAELGGVGKRDETGFLTEFERPRLHMAANEIARIMSAARPRLVGQSELVDLFPGQDVEASVAWDDTFNQFAGTYVEPEDMVDFFGLRGAGKDRAIEALVGEEVSKGSPLLTMERGNFRVNFFSGGNSAPTMVMSELGSELGAYEDVEKRRRFHEAYFEVARWAFRRSPSWLRRDVGSETKARPMWWELDDLTASVVTFESSAEIVLNQLGSDAFAGRVVASGAATGHSVIAMAVMAERRGIPTEYNVGFPTWGLTEGIGPDGEHQNYVATVLGIDKPGKELFAFGDVGDAARRVMGVVGDEYRADDYIKSREDTWIKTWAYLNGGDMRLYYAMGGLFVRGMHYAAGGGNGGSEIMARASRKRGDDGNFYAVFSDLVRPLSVWAQ